MNADGTVKAGETPVDSWTSKKGENHDFGQKLDAGKSYVLIETACPTGYAKITNVPFSVASDGTVTCGLTKNDDGEYEVEDERLVMKVNKFDLTSGDEIDDAVIKIYEAKDVNETRSQSTRGLPRSAKTTTSVRNSTRASRTS